MSTKQDRTALIALVAGGIALLLGLCLGAMAGGVSGYLIGRQVERRVQVDALPRQLPQLPVMPEMPALPETPMQPGRLMGVGGALIQEVVPDSPAQQAGLQIGDVIIAVNGIPIDATHALVDILATFEPGDRVNLQVRRGSRTLTVGATLANNPDGGLRPYLGVRYVDLSR